MTDSSDLTGWRIDKKPPLMTKRYTFDCYDDTRLFVSDLADLSESTGYYPNLTFNQTQATVTISTDEEQLADKEFNFAIETEKLGLKYSKLT